MAHSPEVTDAAMLVLEGLGHLDQGITIFDHNLKLVAWNDVFLEMLGYPRDLAFVGADFASFIDYNARRGEYGPGDPVIQVAERVEKARKFLKHHIERERPDGTVLKVVGTPLPSGGFVTTYTDITDIRRRQELLEETVTQRTRELMLSEQRLKLIADEVPAGIAHFDRDLTILYANKRFAQAYQKTPKDIIGLNASEVLYARTLLESSRFFEQARRGAMVDFEMRVQLPGDRFKDIRTLLRPEKPSSGEVIGFYTVSIDVTRRKATMSALMRSQKMDALGRMASGISHDFNNLLTIILGNLVPLAEHLNDPATEEEFLTPAISAARRGSSLTKRLLTLARREQFDPEPTEIDEAISEICKLLKSSVPASLTIAQDHEPALPQAFVDRGQLEMALLNMALNSRDACEGKGEITIGASRYDLPAEEAELLHLPAGEYLRIRFADNGSGMSPEQAERIFEPFYTSKAAGAGSGLGLSMVYGFVKQSNGAIWVDSQPGRGAEFTILLPSVDLVAKQDITRPEPVEPRPAPRAEPDTGDQPMVLLVEDDQDVRRTIRRKIAGLGYPLVEANNADEALGLLARIRDIRIVISDIDMPGTMKGHALAHRIRNMFPDIRIVLMSGQVQHFPQGSRANGIPFLRKPFSADDLSAALADSQNAPYPTEGVSP
ncbi:PAS-domain containing protein [Actibacterium sp. XHP0104]|uniref:hybrid sensor histidine kinase/response regulator n=1 Tax=Actibacterium sp. XHP0104 TaxID=2984335 RepID=UPI0021E7DCF9|nr:PAS-domain containing protein [Actibacterium sp. XHP0104]MCV2881582.1 PAS-domain containing protein [Actibacterium sp. XHP0104]